MKSLVLYINESQGSVTFRNNRIIVNGEDAKHLFFEYNGKPYKVSKKEVTIDAYGNTWGGALENTVWVVSDGVLKVKPTKDFKENSKDDNRGSILANEVFSIPTVKTIFTNLEIFELSIAYRVEHEDYGWFDDILDDLTLYDFVEGLWVCNGGTFWKKLK